MSTGGEITIPERRRKGDERKVEGGGIVGLHVVMPGEPIVTESGFLRGHGTYVDEAVDQRLITSVCGVVERVNKLVCARPMRGRYVPEVGDVVVGRVAEVGQGRWRVDVGGRSDATLMLSAVNLPGGVQRKRTYEDELNMRSYLQESDVISAEVQAVGGDGVAQLHTRSARYGKLLQGTFLEVPPALVRRCKSHFFSCDFGVSFIFGTNGYVWVYPSTADSVVAAAASSPDAATAAAATALTPAAPVAVTAEVRARLARVRNCFLALSAHGVSIQPATILAAYQSSETAGVPAKEMLRPAISALLATKAREVSVI